MLKDAPVDEAFLELAPALEGEEVVQDYATTGLSLLSHPLALLRPHLAKRRLASAAELEKVKDGRFVRYAGIVTLRQQPETADGTIFISLEDETGVVQVIVWKSLRERQRPEVLRSRLLEVHEALRTGDHDAGDKTGVAARQDQGIGTHVAQKVRCVTVQEEQDKGAADC